MTKVRKTRLLSAKQRQRLISNAKIRKHTKARILQSLNDGTRHNGEGKSSGHMLKQQIRESKQPSRYKP
jgi:hypothetical protein